MIEVKILVNEFGTLYTKLPGESERTIMVDVPELQYYGRLTIRDLQDYKKAPKPGKKHGKWEKFIPWEDEPVTFFRCTICGYENINDSRYCPNCGARMEENGQDCRTCVQDCQFIGCYMPNILECSGYIPAEERE